MDYSVCVLYRTTKRARNMLEDSHSSNALPSSSIYQCNIEHQYGLLTTPFDKAAKLQKESLAAPL